jgi:hypothetical protein
LTIHTMVSVMQALYLQSQRPACVKRARLYKQWLMNCGYLWSTKATLEVMVVLFPFNVTLVGNTGQKPLVLIKNRVRSRACANLIDRYSRVHLPRTRAGPPDQCCPFLARGFLAELKEFATSSLLPPPTSLFTPVRAFSFSTRAF